MWYSDQIWVMLTWFVHIPTQPALCRLHAARNDYKEGGAGVLLTTIARSGPLP
jgi:hypothetical protein